MSTQPSTSGKKAVVFWAHKVILRYSQLYGKKGKPVSGQNRINRGTRGDSLRMLSPSGLSNKKPPLLSKAKVVGVCHNV